MIVDWETYYDAAKKCHALADELRAADKPVHTAVKVDCVGMAGDAPGCKQWSQAYDTAAQQTMQACSSLANALTNYGAVLYAMGYNYGIANKSTPAPGKPDVSQVGLYQVSIPSSAGNNGPGLADHGGIKAFFDKLVAKVLSAFGKLPNGDTGKLDTAHTTWDTFGKHPTIIGAASRISAISATFDGMDDAGHRAMIQANFDTMKTGADSVATAAGNMAAPVGDYHDATVALGKQTAHEINSLELTISVAAVAGGLMALFSVGASEVVADVAIDDAVVETANAIQTAYKASNMPKILGMAALALGGLGVIDAFHAIPGVDLDKAATNLATLIAMKVIIAADGATTVQADQFGNLPAAPNNPAPGMTDEAEKYILGKHMKGGSQYDPSKGTWPDGTTGEDLDELAEAAENSPARGPNKDGNFEREVDADKIIGSVSEQLGGQATTRYKIITDRFGGIVTMYPIP